MKVHLLGGFLGAGKTTLARALAQHLRGAGERPALITNDQGHLLVDTRLCRDVDSAVQEIQGGCFCCRYPVLEIALATADESGATTVIAEAVGSCADVIATVVAPLADRLGHRYELAPYTVVVDPWKVLDVAAGSISPDVGYLYRKQIEEADVVLLTRSDTSPPGVVEQIRAWQPVAPVLSVSGRTGSGIQEWLDIVPSRLSPPLAIDYDRYASAEAQLAWFNGKVRVRRNGAALDARTMIQRFFAALSHAPIAHVKLVGEAPFACWAAMVRSGAAPSIDLDPETASSDEVTLIVNARVATSPGELELLLTTAMKSAALSAIAAWEDVECFSPARPTPTHRYAERCVSTSAATCCAAFYQREDVLKLLGDSHHPGGLALTRRVADALGLRRGDTILDVACGGGESLRAIITDHDVVGLGLDARITPYRDDRLELRAGDAHALPFEPASADAVLCECALSTFVDQPGALREMHRVLRAGGRLAVTDMVLEGEVPETLREWVHSGTCLQRALSARAYVGALTDAGFQVVDSWNASDALRELLRRIKRNLVGWIAASASGAGSLPPRFNLRSARQTLREAEDAVDAGIIRYGVFIAQKPDVS
ncbi:MAG: GTP-binding protein [Gemmatimonadaceae bacterium]